MKRAVLPHGLRVAAVLALALASIASCSDQGFDDGVESACRVMVRQCGAKSTMGACIDDIVSLPPECIDCLNQSGCDYASCQRDPACRLPTNLLQAEK